MIRLRTGKDMAEHNHTTDASAEEKIQSLLETVSSYIEQYHGGWVRLDSFDGKVLRVEMGGACEGCALSATTLRGWVEGTVRQFFPELESIEAI
jgi:Fe-S cluster biogenesis protein NfuA